MLLTKRAFATIKGVPTTASLGLLLCAACCLSVLVAEARTNTPQVNRATARYHEVLDQLFPRERFSERDLVLRYLPAREPESQIHISSEPAGKHRIWQYSLPTGADTVWRQVGKLIEEGSADNSIHLASKIVVEKKVIEVPQERIGELLNTFKKLRLTPDVGVGIVVDGTRYEFWISTAARNEFHLSVADPESRSSRRQNPLIRWMKLVRQEIESAVQTQRKSGEPIS